MDTKFNGKIWTFGDDIDTDTIIPGKRGTIPTIEEMKRYAFELLKPEFGTAVKPGDILVAGKNFGCGSSREQAATVLSHNGVRCIIAKSFARIFFRNAFNNGIILLQCDGIQEVVKDGFGKWQILPCWRQSSESSRNRRTRRSRGRYEGKDQSRLQSA